MATETYKEKPLTYAVPDAQYQAPGTIKTGDRDPRRVELSDRLRDVRIPAGFPIESESAHEDIY